MRCCSERGAQVLGFAAEVSADLNQVIRNVEEGLRRLAVLDVTGGVPVHQDDVGGGGAARVDIGRLGEASLRVYRRLVELLQHTVGSLARLRRSDVVIDDGLLQMLENVMQQLSDSGQVPLLITVEIEALKEELEMSRERSRLHER